MSEPRKECQDRSPSWWAGRWRDWHRGHGCNNDDGEPTSPDGVKEFLEHGRQPGRLAADLGGAKGAWPQAPLDPSEIAEIRARAHAEGKAEGLREAIGVCAEHELEPPGSRTALAIADKLRSLIAPHLPAGEERPAAEEVKP